MTSKMLVMVALVTLLCGCTTKTAETGPGVGQIISVYVPSNDIAWKLRGSLISFATKSGFSRKAFDESDRTDDYPDFGVIYDVPHGPGYTAIALEYATDAGKVGGCLSVTIALASNNQPEFASLVNQIKQIMRVQLPAHTEFYKNTICGIQPMITFSGNTYSIRSLAL